MRWVLAAVVTLGLHPQDAVPTYGVAETATNKAIELRVEGVETATQIAGRRARPGYEFVIVDTLWKNIIPLTPVNRKASSSPTGGLSGFGVGRRAEPAPGDVTMEPTKYVVSMLRRQAWLLSDGRFGDMLDPAAQAATPGHLPVEGFTIAKLDDTVRGKLVFEAPAGAKTRIFQYYDNAHGHLAFRLRNEPLPAAAAGGPERANNLVRLMLTEARVTEGPAHDGRRRYVVGVRGTSASRTDIVDIPIHRIAFLIDDQGCIAQPERLPTGLARPFGEIAAFPPLAANEGQMAFQLPASGKAVALLIRPAQGGAIDLAPSPGFKPAWPTPAQTFADGSTMRVHLLPAPPLPSDLPPPADGTRRLLIDVAIENLSATRGIEFQPVQLRLVMPDGRYVDPSPLSRRLPCRLDGEGVVPAGGVRRFQLLYDVAGDGAPRVHFRGFELQEATADLP